MTMLTSFKTLSGSVYQSKIEDGRTYVRRVLGERETTLRLVSDGVWQECVSVEAKLGHPAVISWGRHRKPTIPDTDGTKTYPLTVTSPVIEIVSEDQEDQE